MTVEDAAKLVISAGLVYPSDRENGEGVKGGLTDLLEKIPTKN